MGAIGGCSSGKGNEMMALLNALQSSGEGQKKASSDGGGIRIDLRAAAPEQSAGSAYAAAGIGGQLDVEA